GCYKVNITNDYDLRGYFLTTFNHYQQLGNTDAKPKSPGRLTVK
ncbi:hypothetical protein CCACVL1_22939, partial [Corchorus capsularis]